MEIHLRTTGCLLPYGITQCYLPPDTSEHTPTLIPAGEGSIYLPLMEGRLSWPRSPITPGPGIEPLGLYVGSPTPYRYATETPKFE